MVSKFAVLKTKYDHVSLGKQFSLTKSLTTNLKKVTATYISWASDFAPDFHQYVINLYLTGVNDWADTMCDFILVESQCDLIYGPIISPIFLTLFN